ncbi:hypothetical protein C2869_14745 [Saccharobesus litoralis]|uniref:Uncharacterized protein n=1 Tax=Saccharobesus litoralis TaxID=2172099 RepID=A0A2S0VTS9_9ALTE|nr:hypothetical protein C2869_14745 [Saccharobesus litoralis]
MSPTSYQAAPPRVNEAAYYGFNLLMQVKNTKRLKFYDIGEDQRLNPHLLMFFCSILSVLLNLILKTQNNQVLRLPLQQ